MMAAYFAMRIMERKLNYKAVFSISFYKPFQDDVNAILVAEGQQDLIDNVAQA